MFSFIYASMPHKDISLLKFSLSILIKQSTNMTKWFCQILQQAQELLAWDSAPEHELVEHNI